MRTPLAPPVYRPQPTPLVLQRKTPGGGASTPPPRQGPTAPPVYRPQHKVVQPKAGGAAKPAPPSQTRPAPSAPPAYRPQPQPKVLQTKKAAVGPAAAVQLHPRGGVRHGGHAAPGATPERQHPRPSPQVRLQPAPQAGRGPALRPPAAPRAATARAGLVQRKVVWKADNHANGALDKFTASLDAMVQKAATTALGEAASMSGEGGYLALWSDTAAIVAEYPDPFAAGDAETQREAIAAHRFKWARFGYAVETLACGNKDALQAALPADYTFQLQPSRGMTRPDIIVKHLGTEVGWFDITSENSIGHIDLKTGSGWKTKPYVAEITYPPLDESMLGNSSKSIGQRIAAKNAVKRRAAAWNKAVDEFAGHFHTEWKSGGGEELGNKEQRKGLVRGIFAQMLGEEVVSPTDAKGLLRVIGHDNLKPFGFESGGESSRGAEMLRSYLAL